MDSPFILETLSSPVPNRNSKGFALISLETLTALAYSFKASKRFALLI